MLRVVVTRVPLRIASRACVRQLQRWQHVAATATPIPSTSPSPIASIPQLPILPPLSDFAAGAARVARAAQTIGASVAANASSFRPGTAGAASSSDPLASITSIVSPFLTLASGRLPLPGGLPSLPATLPNLVMDVARAVAPGVASLARNLIVRPDLHGPAGAPPQAAGVSAPAVATPSPSISATNSSVDIGGTWNYTPVPLTALQRSFLAAGSAALALANTHRGISFYITTLCDIYD